MLHRTTAHLLLGAFCLILPLGQLLAAHQKGHQHHSQAVKYSGTIDKVEQVECQACNCTELSLVLKSDTGPLVVKLGPRQFFEERDFALSPGDMIEVIGVPYKQRDRTVVFASEVRKRSDTIKLRGKYGRPNWLQEHRHTCPWCSN
jgi:hypothetical protein